MNSTRQSHTLTVVAIIGYSGAGKTTLLSKLITLFDKAGVRCGVIKHSHHDVETDQPGKDSWLARKAGATQVLLAGPGQCTLFMDSPGHGADPKLQDLIQCMNPAQLDLILVEGMKYADVPKVEIRRRGSDSDWLYPDDAQIFAVVSDDVLPPGNQPPVFSPDDPEGLAALIQRIIPRS